MDYKNIAVTPEFTKPGMYFLWSTGGPERRNVIIPLDECRTEEELDEAIESAFERDEKNLRELLDEGVRFVACIPPLMTGQN